MKKDEKKLSLNPKHKDNPEVVLQAIKEYAHLLKEASERLNNNETFLIQAIKANPDVLNYISKDIKTYDFFEKSINVILNAIQKKPEIIIHLPNEFCKKPEFILKAIKKNGWSIKFLPITENNEKLASIALLQIFSTRDFIISKNAIAKFNEINSKENAFTEKQWLDFINDEKLLSQLNKELYRTFKNSTMKFDGNFAEFTAFANQLNDGVKRMLKTFENEQKKNKKPLIKKVLDRLRN